MFIFEINKGYFEKSSKKSPVLRMFFEKFFGSSKRRKKFSKHFQRCVSKFENLNRNSKSRIEIRSSYSKFEEQDISIYIKLKKNFNIHSNPSFKNKIIYKNR